MRRILIALVCAAAPVMLGTARAASTLELAAGIHRIEAEVASTPAGRNQGLMHRRALAANAGMLFVFPEAQRHCMWMRNTFLPLSVAFLDAQGVVLNVADMQPETEDTHCAAGEARYALEMNQGWFARRGIRAGMKIFGLDKSPPPR